MLVTSLIYKALKIKMWNLVSRINGRTEAEVVKEWGAEENIWTY
jgi:hypothetical protein